MLDRTFTANWVSPVAWGALLLVTGCITDAEPLDPSANPAAGDFGAAGAAGAARGGASAWRGGAAGILKPTAPFEDEEGGLAGGTSNDSGASDGEGGRVGAKGGGSSGAGGLDDPQSVGSAGSAGDSLGPMAGGPGGVSTVGQAKGGATSDRPREGGGGGVGVVVRGAGEGGGGVGEGAGAAAAHVGGQGGAGAVGGGTSNRGQGGAPIAGEPGAGGEGGCGGQGGEGSRDPGVPWNLLVYLCPDRANRERDWEHLEASLTSINGLEVFALMEDSGEPTRLRRAVALDPSAGGAMGGAGSIEVDVSVLGQGGPNLDLGAPAVLGAFLRYAAQASPNRRTALIVSGIAARANGLWSLCSDETPLGLSELEGVLEGGTMDLLALDGGQVFDLSMTYQLRDAARFLVCSQALDFSDFVGAWMSSPEDSALHLAQAIVQTHDTGVLGVVSALEAQRMDALRDALDELAGALLQHEAADIAALRPDACPGNYAGLQSVDMHALASLLQPPLQGVTSAVEEAVVAHEALDSTGQADSSAYGVAIYLPLVASTELDGYTGETYDLLLSPQRYRDFIDWFLAELE